MMTSKQIETAWSSAATGSPGPGFGEGSLGQATERPAWDFVRVCLALLSAAAGVIHLGVAPAHFAESGLHGAFFVVVGLLQLAAGGLFVAQSGRRLPGAAAAGNAIVVSIWVMSRTSGLPLGPDPWTAEPVGFADVTATLLEVLIVAGSLLLLAPAGSSLVGARPHRAVLALVSIGSILVLLTGFALGTAGPGGSEHPEAGAPPGAHGPAAQGAHAGEAGYATGGAAHEVVRRHPEGAAAEPAAATHGQGLAASDRTAHATASRHARRDVAADPQPAADIPPAMGPRPVEHRASVRYGPIPLLPAVLGVPGRSASIVPVLPMPCSGCYVTGTSVDLVYDDGRSANLDTGVMLHHLVVAQSGLPDTTCAANTPIGLLGQRFFAAGNERTAGALPPGFGYHLGQGPLVAAFDIMNHDDALKTVYLTATVSYLPDSTPGIKPVTPVWLDVNNCSTSEYQVPAGPSNRVWRWTSTITGRVLAAGGHVHDGGIKMVLSNESTNQHICTSRAGYATKPQYRGSIESMTTCIWDRLGTVRAGQVLAIDTYYDTRVPQSDVMGIMIAYVYETDDLAGGTEPPSAGEPAAPSGAQPPSGSPHHR